MFHEVKGKNITLDRPRTQAAWTPFQSGGLTFTERPLSASDPVTLTLEGTGAIELGITSTNPSELFDGVPDVSNQLGEYSFLNDVKIHKRVCTMTIVLDENKQEIISSYGGGQYKQSITRDRNYYLVADVKYGSVEMKLDSEGEDNEKQQFSEVCGKNIKRLNNPAVITSLNKSPSALCFYGEPMTSDLNLLIHCTPKAFQSTIPGRFYLLLRYTTLHPRDFADRYASKFDLQQAPGNVINDPQWPQIEKLEKEECTGSPIIFKFLGDAIEVITATGKRKRTPCRVDADVKVWLVLELYGISVRLEQSNSLTTCMSDIPEETDLFAEPINIPFNAQTTVPVPIAHPDIVRQGQSSRSDFVRRSSQIEDPVELNTAIRKNFIKLKENLKVDELVDYLYESEMITATELTEIGDLDKTRATKKVLIDILSKRPVSKKVFMRALEKTLQQHLQEYFFIDEEDKD